jgi:hypothetical protein
MLRQTRRQGPARDVAQRPATTPSERQVRTTRART